MLILVCCGLLSPVVGASTTLAAAAGAACGAATTAVEGQVEGTQHPVAGAVLPLMLTGCWLPG